MKVNITTSSKKKDNIFVVYSDNEITALVTYKPSATKNREKATELIKSFYSKMKGHGIVHVDITRKHLR